jgi:hypothetical protein
LAGQHQPELQNVIERAVIMTTGPVLNQRATELIAQDIQSARNRTLVDAERAHIIAMLHETNWVVGGRRGAAAQLGLPRTTLISMMGRLGISRETLPQRAGGQPEGEPHRPFVTVPSAHSRETSGLEGEDPVYDYSNSQLKNNTATDFRLMEAV